ncbi:MAG: G8 domain-containing protein [Bacteroidota bacterium]
MKTVQLLFLLSYFGLSFLSAQHLVVGPNDSLILRADPGPLQSLKITGYCQLDLPAGTRLDIGKIELVAGTLQIGTPSSPYAKDLEIVLGQDNETDPALSVGPGSRLSIWAEKENPLLLQPGTNQARPHWVTIDPQADEVTLVGIHFNGFATATGEAAAFLRWIGAKGQLRRCQFTAMHGGVLWLDATSVPLLHNEIETVGGAALVLSPSGIGSGNVLRHNQFRVTASAEQTVAAALRLGNPLQAVEENQISVAHCRIALEYASLPEYQDFLWLNDTQQFSLEANILENKTAAEYDCTGLYFANAHFSTPIKSSRNQVLGFGLGARIAVDQLLLEQWEFRDNRSALAVGGASLRDLHLIGPAPKGELGIAINQGDQALCPRWENLMIHNYATGIRLERPLRAGNSIAGLRLMQVDQPWELATLPRSEALFFPLGDDYLSSILTNDKVTTHCGQQDGGSSGHSMMASTHHGSPASEEPPTHHHHERTSNSISLWPAKHWAIGPGCQQLAGNSDWLICPDASIGQLRLTTGFGQSDPIHEHALSLEEVELRRGEDRSLQRVEGQAVSWDLAADQTYALALNSGQALADFQLEWTADTGKKLQLWMDYPYPDPVVLWALGNEVPWLSSPQAVEAQSGTACYVDREQQRIFLQLQSDQLHTSVVIYRRQMATNIEYAGQRIAVAFEQDAASLRWAYQLPSGTASSFTVTDIHANPLASFELIADEQGWVKVELDRKAYAPNNEAGWFFLEVGDQIHKGPLYW